MRKWKAALCCVALSFAGLAAACTDDAIGPGAHPDAAGVVIFSAATGAELTRSTGSAQAFSNPLSVPADGMLEAEIEFVDSTDPQSTFFPDQGDGQSVRVTIANSVVVTHTSMGNQSDFTALAAGTTIATIDLMHDGHSDFTSGPLTIIVQ